MFTDGWHTHAKQLSHRFLGTPQRITAIPLTVREQKNAVLCRLSSSLFPRYVSSIFYLISLNGAESFTHFN